MLTNRNAAIYRASCAMRRSLVLSLDLIV